MKKTTYETHYMKTWCYFEAQYMSASHGHSTMCGIDYEDGGYVEKTKKEKVSHQRAMEMPID